MQTKNKHKEKAKLARRLMGGRVRTHRTGEERSFKTSLFNNPVWNERKRATEMRIAKSYENEIIGVLPQDDNKLLGKK